MTLIVIVMLVIKKIKMFVLYIYLDTNLEYNYKAVKNLDKSLQKSKS